MKMKKNKKNESYFYYNKMDIDFIIFHTDNLDIFNELFKIYNNVNIKLPFINDTNYITVKKINELEKYISTPNLVEYSTVSEMKYFYYENINYFYIQIIEEFSDNKNINKNILLKESCIPINYLVIKLDYEERFVKINLNLFLKKYIGLISDNKIISINKFDKEINILKNEFNINHGFILKYNKIKISYLKKLYKIISGFGKCATFNYTFQFIEKNNTKLLIMDIDSESG